MFDEWGLQEEAELQAAFMSSCLQRPNKTKIKEAIKQHSSGLAFVCLAYAAGFQNSFEVCILENHFPSHITLQNS